MEPHITPLLHNPGSPGFACNNNTVDLNENTAIPWHSTAARAAKSEA